MRRRTTPAPTTPRRTTPRRGELWQGIRDRHPPFFKAVVEDAKVNCRFRSEPHDLGTRRVAVVQVLRLMWVSDAFFAEVCYRAKAGLQARGVPVPPCGRGPARDGDVAGPHRRSRGDRAGNLRRARNIVVDGLASIGAGSVIFPWVTIGLRGGDTEGPTIGRNVHIGTGAKIIGPVTVGNGARIGANAVVVDDVAVGTTVVGSPARPVAQ